MVGFIGRHAEQNSGGEKKNFKFKRKTIELIVHFQESSIPFKTMSIMNLGGGFLKMTFHDLFTMFFFLLSFTLIYFEFFPIDVFVHDRQFRIKIMLFDYRVKIMMMTKLKKHQ